MDIPENTRKNQPAGAGEEPPPFLGTWNRLYAAVIIYTGVLILALYLLTVAFNS